MGRYAAGEIVVRQGQVMDRMALVLSGAIKMESTDQQAATRTVGYVGSGELVNLLGTLDGIGALYDYIANADVVVLWVRKRFLFEMLEADPGFGRAMLGVMCARVRHVSAALDESGISIKERCARSLIRLESQFGVTHPQGSSIGLRMSQEEFASMVGCARPTVNRALISLAKEGAIALSYASIVVTDRVRLMAMTCVGREALEA
jgi:CRP-like cAMP-binding protein